MARAGQGQGNKELFKELKKLKGDLSRIQAMPEENLNQFLAMIGAPEKQRQVRASRKLTPAQKGAFALYLLPFNTAAPASAPSGDAVIAATRFKSSITKISAGILDTAIGTGWRSEANILVPTEALKEHGKSADNFYPAALELDFQKLEQGQIVMETVTNRVQGEQEERVNSRSATLPYGASDDLFIEHVSENETREGIVNYIKEQLGEGTNAAYRLGSVGYKPEEWKYINVKGHEDLPATKLTEVVW